MWSLSMSELIIRPFGKERTRRTPLFARVMLVRARVSLVSLSSRLVTFTVCFLLKDHDFRFFKFYPIFG
jgi:hypothetical protein